MKEMKEWDKLKVFYHVAKAGNITRAATDMGITQPSVSRTIRLLEERVQATLFIRVARGVDLTKEGKILFAHASRIFAEVDAAMKFIDGKEDSPEGELNILTTQGLTYSWLAYLLPGFLEAYPDIKPVVTGRDDTNDLGDYDVAILPFIPNRPDLIQRHVATFHMRLFASRDYLDKFGTPKTPEDLRQHRLIIYGESAPCALGPLAVLAKKGAASSSYIQMNSARGRLVLAQMGMGITELGQDHPKLDNVDLVQVLPEYGGANVEYYCIYPYHMQNSERIVSLANYFDKIKSDAN